MVTLQRGRLSDTIGGVVLAASRILPCEVMGNKIYCNRENRRIRKELGIRLVGKQLGRPSEKDRVE